MTHDDAIAILRATVATEPATEWPGAEGRRAAEQHVSRCPECWEVVRQLHRERFGSEDPADAARMSDLFGCASVQQRLYLLVGMDQEQIAAAAPDLGHHLGWCLSCRGQLAELIAIERLETTTPPAWRALAGTMGDAIRELIGQTVVRVQHGVATIITAPAGVALSAPAVVARGGAESRGRRLRLSLDDSGLTADVAFHPDGEERIALEITVTGTSTAASPLTIALRTGDGDWHELLASQTAHAEQAVMFRRVPPGRYALEIVDRTTAHRFRSRVDVVAAR